MVGRIRTCASLHPTRRGRVSLLCLFLLTTGCNFATIRNWRRDADPFGPQSKCALPPDPSLPEIVSHLNDNITQMYGWEATNAKIHFRGDGGIPITLSANVAVESPRNFRLVAMSLAGTEVDLGSNVDRFWFWARRNPTRNVFFAGHEELPQAQYRLQIPFEPDWVIETLGVVPLDAAKLELRRSHSTAGQAELVAKEVSPEGRVVEKVIVVDTCHGLVLQQILQEPGGRLIAQANFSKHKVQHPHQVVLPQRIDLKWPEAGLTLRMDLGPIDVNPTNMSPRLWRMPEMAGYPPLNLSR